MKVARFRAASTRSESAAELEEQRFDSAEDAVAGFVEYIDD